MNPSPQELYEKANRHLKSNEHKQLLVTCNTLLNNFPDSDEAVLVVKNFPIKWDKQLKLTRLKYPYLIYKKRIPIIITLIILTPFLTIYMPGFKGQVVDKETGKPIHDAYVITFADYYPFSQAFNVGGGNSERDSMQVAKTDKNGYFRVWPYFKFSAGWIETRRTFIFKKGYIYAAGCSQDSWWYLGTWHGNKSIFKTNIFYLSNKESLSPDGEPIRSSYPGLLVNADFYHDYYKYKRNYKSVRPLFIEIYQILSYHSKDIIRTFHEPNEIENWEFDLAGFSDDLGLTKGAQWEVGKHKYVRPAVSDNSDLQMNKLKFIFKEFDKVINFDSKLSEYLSYHDAFHDSKGIAESLNEKQFIKQSYCNKLITLYSSLSDKELSTLDKYSINPIYNHQKEVVEYCENTSAIDKEQK